MKLWNVKEPKLYRDMFPFKGAPKAVFDGVVIHTNIPSNLWISDTSILGN